VGERLRIAAPDTLIDLHDGHHVSANPALDRGVVKALRLALLNGMLAQGKPKARIAGRSEAESLDDAETSATLACVMADGPR
jgi:hypothetical protein